MTTSDLTASEIESPPAGEPSYLLSARIYDSATNATDTFNALVTQLDQDGKSGAASGIQIDYDTQGKVSAITINNQGLYSSTDDTLPQKLLATQVAAEVNNGDMAGALNDSLIVTNTFGQDNGDAVKQAVIDGLGSNLGSLLGQTDLTPARQYLAQLEQSDGSDATNMLAVLQKAKDGSGLGDRVTVETDPQTGAATAFKIDGQDLLSEAPPTTDAATQPSSADGQPVDLFNSNRNYIPTDQAPSVTPPVDGPPVVPTQTNSASGPTVEVPTTNTAAPVIDSNTPSGPITGDTTNTQGPTVEVPTTNTTAPAIDSNTPSGPITGDNTTAAGPTAVDTTRGAGPTTADGSQMTMTEQDHKDHHQYEKAMSCIIDHDNASSPVLRGEGYYQVVTRMHEGWSDEQIMAETHRLKDLNGDSDELRIGQRLPMISPEDKADQVKKAMDAFDQATPEQRQQLLDQAKQQAQSDKHEDRDAPHRDDESAQRPYRSKGNN